MTCNRISASNTPDPSDSTYEPQVVKKRQKDIFGINQKIISMYAKGMITRKISDTLMDIYGFEASEGFISDVTDNLLPQIEEWQNRLLDEVSPVLSIDAIHHSGRDNGAKKSGYVRHSRNKLREPFLCVRTFSFGLN